MLLVMPLVPETALVLALRRLVAYPARGSHDLLSLTETFPQLVWVL